MSATVLAAASSDMLGALVTDIAEILGLGLVAAGVSALAAFLFRWYANQRAPLGLSVLVGLGAVAAILNTNLALGQVLSGEDPISASLALFNMGAFAVGAFASAGGQRVGDRLAIDFFVATGAKTVDSGVSRVVQAVGRAITVELPEDIEDIVGYDAVDAETKTDLAGRTLVFPRRLTVNELRERLVERLKADYGVGHVDVELDEDGSVSFLAVGQRAAGLGPSLPPESAAVAIRADPAYAASVGDVVQVWTAGGDERICNAEIRGTAGNIVTLAVDAADAQLFDRTATYRLVTLSVDARPDREFASLLRGADETMGVVTVAEGSSLVGTPLGALDATVIGIGAAEGGSSIDTLPGREHVIAAGEAVYVVATPDALRKLERAAAAAAVPADD